MKKLAITVSMATLIICSIFLVNNSSDKVSGNKITEEVVLKTENLLENGKIKHSVTKDNEDSKEIEVRVNMNNGNLNKQDMANYKKENSKNMASLAKTKSIIPSTVTFTSPISIDEFETLVNKNQIQVESFNLIALDNNNMHQFIQGVPNEESIIPKDKLEEVLNGADLEGVYAFKGNIPSKFIEAFNSNKSVYLTDVSKTILTEKSNKLKKEDEHLDVHVDDVFWFVNEIE